MAIALGLMLLTVSGQAQEEPQGGQGQTSQQQDPPRPLPIPLPVEIVEDQAAADARQRREEEATKREFDNLVAQQGINAATQAMNEATQRMALYSLISTALVGIGTVCLLGTLVLSAQANKSASLAAKAALDTVEITRETGVAQTRSYISVVGGGFILNQGGFHGWVDVANSGVSASISPKIEASIDLEPAWFGGGLMGVRGGPLDVGTFTARKNKIQPGETSRFYFHWTREQIGNRFDAFGNERNTIVVSVRLESQSIYKGVIDSGEWQLTNHPGFVRVTERSRIAEGPLHPRQLQRG
jgi:hypothetical protein